MKVLFLSQWYPHKYDLMAGLFVQKHAEAVSLFCEVKVLYVHADEHTEKFVIEEKTHAGFSETIVYFPNKREKSFYHIRKIINYLWAYYIGFKRIGETGFKPDIVHANILTRTGLIALIFKLLKNKPYIITEHWTRYLPLSNSYKGFLRKLLTYWVVRNASAILPVSNNLKNAMLFHKLRNKNYIVVDNVVDNFFMQPQQIVQHNKKRILHVSCFIEKAKNVKGLLRAISELSKKRNDFELYIIGNGPDFIEVTQYAETLNFPSGTIHFLGEKTPREVAEWMQNSDFFVLFSNYENSPVVIAESLACGKPVISTDVGGISEMIDSSNGRLIPKGDENRLTKEMDLMLDHFNEYDSSQIKTNSESRYSYKSVGSIIYQIYKKATHEI